MTIEEAKSAYRDSYVIYLDVLKNTSNLDRQRSAYERYEEADRQLDRVIHEARKSGF